MNDKEAMLNELESSDDVLLEKVFPDDDFSISPEITQSLEKGRESIEPEVIAERAEQAPPIEPEASTRSIQTTEKGKVSYQMDELINAESAVNLIGWGMPMAAVILARVLPMDFGDEPKIKKEMKLTAEDKKALEKPLERLLAETRVGTASPLLAFLVVFLMIFVSKMAMLYIDSDEDSTPQKVARQARKRQRRTPAKKEAAPRRTNDRDILIDFKPDESFR